MVVTKIIDANSLLHPPLKNKEPNWKCILQLKHSIARLVAKP
jgi:hypothetical protein